MTPHTITLLVGGQHHSLEAGKVTIDQTADDIETHQRNSSRPHKK